VTRKDFRDALLFVNAAGYLAERAAHHPDILIAWNAVTLTLITHSAGGLTEKDFALARQINELS
jgi:4a-hydroxytetrahydrobiopterin dehydratase